MTEKKRSQQLRYLCIVSLFVAIELLMKLAGLGNIPINPFLNVTLMNIPVAVGAMLLGPAAGAILGAVFGMTSFIQPMSAMVVSLFAINAFHTVIMCVAMRTLMGFCAGWIFKLLSRVDSKKVFCYFGGAFSAAFLNTLLFMGYLVMAFYQTEYVQGKVEALVLEAVIGSIGTDEYASLVERVSCANTRPMVEEGVMGNLEEP